MLLAPPIPGPSPPPPRIGTAGTEQGLKLVGASLVQSWEVTLAELRPTLVRFNGQEAGGEMVNRWSDALVPIETPYQALIRNCPALLTQGLAQAEATGKLAPLTEVLLTRIEELGPLTAEGWLRTLGHVDPILDTLPNAGAIKNRIQAEGPRLGWVMALTPM